MVNHLRGHHTSVSDSTRRRESDGKQQLLLLNSLFHADIDSAKSITKAMGVFTAKDAKDVQPYAVMEGCKISAYDDDKCLSCAPTHSNSLYRLDEALSKNCPTYVALSL